MPAQTIQYPANFLPTKDCLVLNLMVRIEGDCLFQIFCLDSQKQIRFFVNSDYLAHQLQNKASVDILETSLDSNIDNPVIRKIVFACIAEKHDHGSSNSAKNIQLPSINLDQFITSAEVEKINQIQSEVSKNLIIENGLSQKFEQLNIDEPDLITLPVDSNVDLIDDRTPPVIQNKISTQTKNAEKSPEKIIYSSSEASSQLKPEPCEKDPKLSLTDIELDEIHLENPSSDPKNSCEKIESQDLESKNEFEEFERAFEVWNAGNITGIFFILS